MLYQEINDDIKKAMKAQDAFRLSVLRMMKSKIMNVNARGELPDEEITAILRSYLKTLKDAHDQALQAGREKDAADLSLETDIVNEYLPRVMTEDETREAVIRIMTEHGYHTKQDFGKIIKELMSKYRNVDGVTARNVINSMIH